MRHTLAKAVAVGAVAAALLGGMTDTASALPAFKGAGFTVRNVDRMTVTWTIPTIKCAAGESADAVVVGLMGPAVGTADGWNAASVTGCDAGRPWYRIQTWVNAVGGGHATADATAGDVIQAKLINADTAHPSLSVQDLTHPAIAGWKLNKVTTVASPGAYAGANVPNFGGVNFKVSANNYTPLSRMDHARHVQMKGNIKQIGSGHLWSDGMHYSVYFKHH